MTHSLTHSIFSHSNRTNGGEKSCRRLRVDEVVSINRRSTVLELSSTPESLEDEIDGGINKHDGGVGEARSEVDDGGKAGAEVDDGGEAGAKRDGGVDASVSQQQQASICTASEKQNPIYLEAERDGGFNERPVALYGGVGDVEANDHDELVVLVDDCVVVKDDCDEKDVDDGNCFGASEEGCQNMLEHFGEAVRDENTRSDSDSWDYIWDDERIPDPLSSDSEEDEVAAPET